MLNLDKRAIAELVDRLLPGGPDNVHGTSFDKQTAERRFADYLETFTEPKERAVLESYFGALCDEEDQC